jgi:hypothetical protein
MRKLRKILLGIAASVIVQAVIASAIATARANRKPAAD